MKQESKAKESVANERTRLLSRPAVEGITIPVAQFSIVSKFLSIPSLAYNHHKVAFGLSCASVLVCWLCGYADKKLIDPLIFKSIFVVFGFALGFRNVRANERHLLAMSYAQGLFAASWGIIVIFKDREERRPVQEALLNLLMQFADHVELIGNKTTYWYGMIGLQPTSLKEDGDEEQTESQVEANLSPRTLLISIFLMIEDRIGRLEDFPKQGMRRTFWKLRDNMLFAFDGIECLVLPSVTTRYNALINVVCTAFGMALPWGVSTKAFQVDIGKHGKWDVSGGVFLFINTMLCLCVLFGLNGLAKEMEDPFAKSNSDELDLHKLACAFGTSLESYEARRAHVESFDDLQGTGADLMAKRHSFICGSYSDACSSSDAVES